MSFIEGSHTTKNTASGIDSCYDPVFKSLQLRFQKYKITDDFTFIL